MAAQDTPEERIERALREIIAAMGELSDRRWMTHINHDTGLVALAGHQDKGGLLHRRTRDGVTVDTWEPAYD